MRTGDGGGDLRNLGLGKFRHQISKARKFRLNLSGIVEDVTVARNRLKLLGMLPPASSSLWAVAIR
jgi:hypothetical protein